MHEHPVSRDIRNNQTFGPGELLHSLVIALGRGESLRKLGNSQKMPVVRTASVIQPLHPTCQLVLIAERKNTRQRKALVVGHRTHTSGPAVCDRKADMIMQDLSRF